MLPGGMIFPEYRIICCKYLVHLNLSCCFLYKRGALWPWQIYKGCEESWMSWGITCNYHHRLKIY